MALTKTQINYLADKLSRTVEDKVVEFKKSLKQEENFDTVLVGLLEEGKIKLLPKSELIKVFKAKAKSGYYYNASVYLKELIDADTIEALEKERNQNSNKVQEYRNKLELAKTNALDKIVLEGIDVETAIAELNNIPA